MQADPSISAPQALANADQRYWHKDHLGSIVASTNANLTVIERLAYEPFGKRRFANGQYDQAGSIDASSTSRGFTGHEHLDSLDFIHMNARVYDPDMGRFLSPDPTVSHANNPQAFNRYSYVMNNPLNLYDPSGFTTEGENSEASTGCNTCSLSKESVTNATTGKGPSTNSNAHDKQTAAIPDAEKSPGQEYNKEVSQLGRETFRKGEVALETVAKETLFAVMFGGVGRLATGLATNLGRFAGKLAGVFRGERKVAGATDAAAKGAGNIPWGFWRDYPKVTVNGREYAQVGDRLYTQHAVDRMTPSGLGTAAGAKAGDGVGRSISPNSVEAVITSGNRADVEVKGVMRSIYTSGSVEVVTEGAGKVVITVNPFKY